MRKTLAAKLKSDAVKQEMDRAEDLKRSCLRAMSAVAIEVAGAAEHEAFRKVVEGTIEPSETLRGMYEKALEEAGGAARGRA
jgi:cullin-associated NEDD8-dissociated protein 1